MSVGNFNILVYLFLSVLGIILVELAELSSPTGSVSRSGAVCILVAPWRHSTVPMRRLEADEDGSSWTSTREHNGKESV